MKKKVLPRPMAILASTLALAAGVVMLSLPTATAADEKETACAAVKDKLRFPDHWGATPQIETRDIKPLPAGYGSGSTTMFNWITANLARDAAKAKKAGWTLLFNSQSLDNFEVKSGFATYETKNGSIVGTTVEGSGNSFLCTKKEYGDFELQFDVRLDRRLNSGVQIRSKLRNPEGKYGGRVYGPQIEIEAGGKDGGVAGYVYGEATGRGWLTPEERLKAHKHFRDREWNHYRVVAKGPRIQTWINGHKVEDLTDEAIYKKHEKGLIGLQVHGIGKNTGPFCVAWRNLRIRKAEG